MALQDLFVKRTKSSFRSRQVFQSTTSLEFSSVGGIRWFEKYDQASKNLAASLDAGDRSLLAWAKADLEASRQSENRTSPEIIKLLEDDVFVEILRLELLVYLSAGKRLYELTYACSSDDIDFVFKIYGFLERAFASLTEHEDGSLDDKVQGLFDDKKIGQSTRKTAAALKEEAKEIAKKAKNYFYDLFYSDAGDYAAQTKLVEGARLLHPYQLIIEGASVQGIQRAIDDLSPVAPIEVVRGAKSEVVGAMREVSKVAESIDLRNVSTANFWSGRADQFPNLWELVSRVCTLQFQSTTCERVFSTHSNLFTKSQLANMKRDYHEGSLMLACNGRDANGRGRWSPGSGSEGEDDSSMIVDDG
jgi:hypothetical protein